MRALIIRFLDWVLSPFDWVDEDRDMGYVPNAMDGIQDDEKD